METIDIFYQGHGIVEFEHIEVQPDHTIAMVKQVIAEKHGLADGLLAFLEDQNEPLDETLMIRAICEGRAAKIHVHHCREIEVAVTFAGDTVHHQFAPATTVGHVKNWAAIKKFHMSEAEAGEHQLQLGGTKDRPAPGTHIGSLTRCPDCRVHFDLVPDERVNGASLDGV
jgi:hypothetical protein